MGTVILKMLSQMQDTLQILKLLLDHVIVINKRDNSVQWTTVILKMKCTGDDDTDIKTDKSQRFTLVNSFISNAK